MKEYANGADGYVLGEGRKNDEKITPPRLRRYVTPPRMGSTGVRVGKVVD